MNYSSKFVLYVSTCSGCTENQIAESNIKLHERMTLNRLAGFELAPSGTPVRRYQFKKMMKFSLYVSLRMILK